MAISIADIFPNANIGLSQIGFLFGAGSSLCAGYPLTKELTIQVLARLEKNELDTISELVYKESLEFSSEEGIPDIELISDIIMKNVILTSDKKFTELEESLMKSLYNSIYSVEEIDLSYHQRFLTSIKKILYNQSQQIWIFTTNYDLLFEKAALTAKIDIRNGFNGISHRYFNIEDFENVKGTIGTNSRFQLLREPSINLVKLHGSVTWFKDNSNVIERFDNENNNQHCMILPRGSKVIETLQTPYDQIFRYSSNVIGRKCKYLATLGYSYRDQHINQFLLLPKLKNGSISIFAFLKEETDGLQEFKQYPNFNFLVNSKYKIKSNEISEESNLWDFKEFIKIFENL